MTNGTRRTSGNQPRTASRRNVSRNAHAQAHNRSTGQRVGASRSACSAQRASGQRVQRPVADAGASRNHQARAGASAPGFRQPALWTKEQPRRSTSSSQGRAARSYQPQSRGANAVAVFQGALSAAGTALRFIGSCLLKLFSLLGALMRTSRVAFVVVLAACAIVVGLAADGIATSGRAYQGVHVGSVDVSGMNAQEIAQALDAEYAQPLQAASVTVFASDEAASQTAEAAQEQSQQDAALAEQMAVDEAKAAKQAWVAEGASLGAHVDNQSLTASALAVGREDGGVLSRLKSQLFGTSITVDVVFDNRALDEFASEIDSAIGDARVDYDIAVSSGVAYVQPGHDGWEVNRQQLGSQLAQAMLSGGGQLVAHTEFAPVRITEDAATAAASAVTSALSQGATFEYDGKEWEASSTEVGAWVATSLEEQGDSWCLRPYIDSELAKSSMLAGIRQADGNALSGVKFSVSEDGSVRVLTDGQGSLPLVADAACSLSAALFGLGSDIAPAQNAPHVQVGSTAMPSELSFDDAVAYGIVGPIGTCTTQYTTGQGTEDRNHNIALVSQLLDNSVCEAGNSWSYNTTTGDCNEEKGFLGAGAIIDGEYTDSVGGGICQVATTVFNAVYNSGLPITERHNHSLYIASYPQGRDAAVSYPELDLVWQNDTANDVLVKVSCAEGSVTATLYGVDSGYVVSTETGQWEAGKKYSTTTKVDTSLAPGTSYVKTRGTDGSTIEVTRTVKDVNGNIVRQDLFASVYDPVNEVVVKGPETTAG